MVWVLFFYATESKSTMDQQQQQKQKGCFYLRASSLFFFAYFDPSRVRDDDEGVAWRWYFIVVCRGGICEFWRETNKRILVF